MRWVFIKGKRNCLYSELRKALGDARRARIFHEVLKEIGTLIAPAP